MNLSEKQIAVLRLLKTGWILEVIMSSFGFGRSITMTKGKGFYRVHPATFDSLLRRSLIEQYTRRRDPFTYSLRTYRLSDQGRKAWEEYVSL